jgi:hypothetical protein
MKSANNCTYKGKSPHKFLFTKENQRAVAPKAIYPPPLWAEVFPHYVNDFLKRESHQNSGGFLLIALDPQIVAPDGGLRIAE